MDYVMLILRLTHISAGVFWVGATLTTSFYPRSASDVTGDIGLEVILDFMRMTRLATAMTVAGILTVLAGYSMYWLDSDGFSSAWVHSGPGIGFAIGGASGLFGLISRILANRNMSKLRMVAAESNQERPANEQSQSLVSLQKRQARLDALNTWTLIIAVLFMATARYLVF